MAGPIRHTKGRARRGLEKSRGIRYIIQNGHSTSGPNPGVGDRGPARLPPGRSHWFGSGRRIRTGISTLVGAGVLPLDEPRELCRLRAATFLARELGSGPSYSSSPRTPVGRTPGLATFFMGCFTTRFCLQICLQVILYLKFLWRASP